MSQRKLWGLLGAVALVACAPSNALAPGAGPSPASSLGPSDAPSASPMPTPSVQPALLRVSGGVFDEQLGRLAGAEISASGVPNAKVLSDAQGQYRLSLPPGNHTLVATKAGMVTRSRTLRVQSDVDGFNFGGIEPDGLTSPYFLTGALEVVSASLNESSAGGPFALDLVFSEAVATGAAQQAAIDLVELSSSGNAPFLRTVRGGLAKLQMDAKFEDGGRRLHLTYPGPYLASGPLSGVVRYAVHFRQAATDKRDPVTREVLYEDMGIVDAEGQALGRGRAAYAFLLTPLSFLNGQVMVDKTYGYGPADRRWNLTHTGQVGFEAKVDTTLPALLQASVDVEELVGTASRDLLRLTFNKAMRVAKDRAVPEFTRLDLDKDLLVVNVAKDDGVFKPLGGAKPVELEFLDQEPNVVYLRYASGTFKDYKRVEVLLGRDALDPSGNAPDPQRSRVEGRVS